LLLVGVGSITGAVVVVGAAVVVTVVVILLFASVLVLGSLPEHAEIIGINITPVRIAEIILTQRFFFIQTPH
jgi:hypothetical protein